MGNSEKRGVIKEMLGDFYRKEMASIVVLFWIYAIIAIAIIVWACLKFSCSEDVKTQLFAATAFMFGVVLISVIKILSWQIINRNNINRKIKGLEDKIDAISDTLKG